jgi:hypothetical protein
MTDPLRQQRPGQQSAAVRFGFAAPAPEPPKPEPAPPPRRGPLIPAGPMGGGPDSGDLIRLALRRTRR